MATPKPIEIKTVWRRLEKARTEFDWAEAVASLARLPNPDTKGPTGFTLLMMASRRGNLDVVNVLLAAGANPNADDASVGGPPTAYSVLHYALDRPQEVERGGPGAASALLRQEAVIRRLLEAGADPTPPMIWEKACFGGTRLAMLLLEDGRLAAGFTSQTHETLFGILFSTAPVACVLEKEDPLMWGRVMDRLIALGVNPSACDVGGDTVWGNFQSGRRFKIFGDEEREVAFALRAQWEQRTMGERLSPPAPSPAPSRQRM